MIVYEGQEIADQWYSEVERYNFKKHSGPNTGIYVAISNYIVCQFSP